MITKGKWKVVVGEYNYSDDDDKGTGSICVDDDEAGYYICTMEEVETLEGVSQWRDNANLIKAAPDMLEALQQITSALQAYYGLDMLEDTGYTLLVNAIRYSNDAIKKAEGR